MRKHGVSVFGQARVSARGGGGTVGMWDPVASWTGGMGQIPSSSEQQGPGRPLPRPITEAQDRTKASGPAGCTAAASRTPQHTLGSPPQNPDRPPLKPISLGHQRGC